MKPYRKPRGGQYIKRAFIAWRGPSQLTGAPVVVIVTFDSDNPKTGDMAQVWYLADNECSPQENLNLGTDSAICGDCKLRGELCYVRAWQAPGRVFDAYRRGRYEDLSEYPQEQARRVMHYGVRLGAYGDPTSAPLIVSQHLRDSSEEATGYTHQWRRPEFDSFKHLVMASCDSEAEARDAQALGWKTFRIRLPEEPLLNNEVVCLAAKEFTGKYRLTCDQCRKCDGRTCNVAIIAHGGIENRAGEPSTLRKFRTFRLERAVSLT